MSMDPGRYPRTAPPEYLSSKDRKAGRKNPKYLHWEVERETWTRGFSMKDFAWLETQINISGLDVFLRIPRIPNNVNRVDQWFTNPQSKFWQGSSLVSIDLDHGPLWLEFIASDFRHASDVHHHISLCYKKELWKWWETHQDMSLIQEWFDRYEAVRKRYDGRRARLYGDFTTGKTLKLNRYTRVEGLDTPHIIWDGMVARYVKDEYDKEVPTMQLQNGYTDDDVRFVHTLPGNDFGIRVAHWKESSAQYKSLQPLHVSMLL
jgi:hypothetical protein